MLVQYNETCKMAIKHSPWPIWLAMLFTVLWHVAWDQKTVGLFGLPVIAGLIPLPLFVY